METLEYKFNNYVNLTYGKKFFFHTSCSYILGAFILLFSITLQFIMIILDYKLHLLPTGNRINNSSLYEYDREPSIFRSGKNKTFVEEMYRSI